MKRLTALFLIVLLIPFAAHAKELNGDYLKQSCTAFVNAASLQFEGRSDAFDKGLDAGFCSGFLLGILNTNFRLTDAGKASLFCPPQDLPVTEAASLIVRELDNQPPQKILDGKGLDLALEIFAKTYPCNEQ